MPWQAILWSKLAKSDYSPLFVVLTFWNGLQYRHSAVKKFICDDLATMCVNLMTFGPVTLLKNHLRQIISQSTRPIFTKFSPYGRYLIVDLIFYFRSFKGRCVGWNLKHSEYIFGVWPWQILGAIRAVATNGKLGEIFFFLSGIQRTISPISRRPNFTKFEHNTSIGVAIKLLNRILKILP